MNQFSFFKTSDFMLFSLPPLFTLFPMRNLNIFSSIPFLYLDYILLFCISLCTVWLLCFLLDSKCLMTGSFCICNSSVLSIILGILVLIKLSSHFEELDLVHLTCRLIKWFVPDCSVKVSKTLGWVLLLSGEIYLRNIIMSYAEAFDQERIE